MEKGTIRSVELFSILQYVETLSSPLSPSDSQKLAFNAGLVIFGALLVSSKESIHDPSQWSIVDRARPYLDIAVDALKRLDSGNRVIERCVEYLSQISVVLMALSKFMFLNLDPLTPR